MKFDKEQIIALVGVSQKSSKYGHKIFKDLLSAGYKVYGINPKGGEILQQKIYSSLEKLPKLPDLVITVVPPQITEQIVETCHKLGIKKIWMQPGSESDQAIKKAKKYGIETISQACFMVQENIW